MKRAAARIASVIIFVATACASQAHGQADTLPRFRYSGDFRLRYENTSRDVVSSSDIRNREVFRIRAGTIVTINEFLTAGARLTTGSSDDPNSTDVTLGSFVNDLEVSLDRAYLQFGYRNLVLTGGKFPNPFLRASEVIWDGDVNPQGLAGSYTVPGAGAITPKLTGMYGVVDEQSSGPDSYMWGGQVGLSFKAAADLNVTVAGAYYDYVIESLSSADAGDTRSNNLTADESAYVSDFDLLDATAIVSSGGIGERYPIRVVGNYVKNLGAEVEQDQGLALGIYVGRTGTKGDRRVHYGYSQAESDAVLASFSHDNTTLATNYELHTLAVDYVPLRNTVLNATWYLYRRKDIPASRPNDFISRLRLNLLLTF
jgi:hypothetical protein